jgi:hypothetical protein
MYKAISELVPDVSFAVFTGDIVDHTIWNTSKPYNEAESRCPCQTMILSRMLISL